MRRVGYSVDTKRSSLVKGRNQTVTEDELGVFRQAVQAVSPFGCDTILDINRC